MATQETDPFAAMGGGVKLASGGWVPKDHPSALQAPAAPPAPAPAPATPGQPQSAGQALAAPVAAGNQVQQGQQTNVAGAFQQALVNKLTQPIASAQSAELQPALAANRLAEQRGAERQRNVLAEQAAAQGTNMSGGFDSRLLGIQQDRAAREGQFAGNAVMQLGNRQAQELMSALALGGGMLGDQDRLAAQERLAALDAQLRREGLSLQGSLGGQDLALRDKLGSGQLNLGLLSALLQNQQFGQNLGANLGMFGANLNQQALLNLIGPGGL